MNTKRILILLSMCIGLSLQAQAQKLSVGANAGLSGFGFETSFAINESIHIRGGANFLPASYADTFEGDDFDFPVKYDATIDFKSFQLGADFYPASQKVFFLGTGLVINNKEIRANIEADGPYELNENRTLRADQMGSMSATIGLGEKIAPYLVMGFGNVIKPNRRVGATVRMGVIYTNSPSVTMQGTGLISPTAEQAPDFENGLAPVKFYPVFNLGLNIKII